MKIHPVPNTTVLGRGRCHRQHECIRSRHTGSGDGGKGVYAHGDGGTTHDGHKKSGRIGNPHGQEGRGHHKTHDHPARTDADGPDGIQIMHG